MTRDEVEALILSFPEVERSTSYGEPSFKVQGKFFTWLLPQLDDSVVVQWTAWMSRSCSLKRTRRRFMSLTAGRAEAHR